MVQFNFNERTIKAKVVYYGPAQSGKTTNLEQIHKLTDPQGANRLVSLNTAQDRTLFFDLLPFSLGAVSGYDFKVQLYTVPGQVQYNATRRVVLAGADAVVFVADARKAMAKENQSAFENMKVNLLANRLVPEKVPLVLQYNKQDLPELQSVEEMDRVLNLWKRPSFPAVAASGRGVMDTFVSIVQEMLVSIAVKYNLREKGLDPAEVPKVVAEAFRNVLDQAAEQAPPPGAPEPAPAKVVISQAPEVDKSGPMPAVGRDSGGLVSEELLTRAIHSNVELAEALAGLVQQMNIGLGSIMSHAELITVYKDDAREKRLAAVEAIQREAHRLRRTMQDLGKAGAAAKTTPATTAAQHEPQAAAPMRPLVPSSGAPAPAAGTASTAAPRVAAAPSPVEAAALEATLRIAVSDAKQALDARGLAVEVQVHPGTMPPRCAPERLNRIVVAALQGIATSATNSVPAVLRCERKPVLLRGRDGAEARRDFVMLALSHTAEWSAEDQQRITQGSHQSPLGEAARIVREQGGFVRFAPLPKGGVETRFFLPAA